MTDAHCASLAATMELLMPRHDGRSAKWEAVCNYLWSLMPNQSQTAHTLELAEGKMNHFSGPQPADQYYGIFPIGAILITAAFILGYSFVQLMQPWNLERIANTLLTDPYTRSSTGVLDFYPY